MWFALKYSSGKSLIPSILLMRMKASRGYRLHFLMILIDFVQGSLRVLFLPIFMARWRKQTLDVKYCTRRAILQNLQISFGNTVMRVKTLTS
jgi:hypothetical protein